MILAGILIALIVGIIAFLQLGQSPDTVANLPQPEPENVLLATVGDKKIYRQDVKGIALEQYLQSAIDAEAIKIFLDVAIERAILDIEASRLGVSVKGTGETSQAYYDRVKNAITGGEISKVDATQIGWWLPPPEEYPQIPLYDVQREEEVKAVPEITRRLKTNEAVMDILSDVYQKYPSLQTVISVNGVRYLGPNSSTKILINREYDPNSSVAYFPGARLMREMRTGEVRSEIWKDKSGATIIKVNNITPGAKFDYLEWLKEKRNDLVVQNEGGIKSL